MQHDNVCSCLGMRPVRALGLEGLDLTKFILCFSGTSSEYLGHARVLRSMSRLCECSKYKYVHGLSFTERKS